MQPTTTPRRTARLLRRGAVAALLPMAFVACGSDGGSSTADPTPAGSGSGSGSDVSGSEVQIKLIAFKPPKLAVTAGTTVTWKQMDPGVHTVTSGTVEQGAGNVSVTPDDTFASGELTTDQTFDFAFSQPGTYPYYCEIHPATMRGEITVR